MDSSAVHWLNLPLEQRQQQIKQLVEGNSQTDFINLVNAGDYGVFASLGKHFDYAVFGRDSLQVAEDLLATHKDLVEKIILTLARLQGTKSNPRNEEELGKIHHEYRSKNFGGQEIPAESLEIMRNLQRFWGNEAEDSLCYYGSHDATLMYIRLLGDYVKTYGADFLYQTYDSALGQKRIGDSLRTAVDWLVNKLLSSSWQLFEYKRLNTDSGIANQSWKDSATSYLHSDGSLVNFDGGVASVDLQGMAYDALQVGARLVAKSDEERQQWLSLTTAMQRQTIDRMWMEEQGYFAQGLDRTTDGQPRQIDTFTSNPALLLNSNLLSDLPRSERQEYIDSIANVISSQEFMTAAGIRCRALKHEHMPGFVDYHGSYTVWPKETFAIAKGLRRHGMPDLANQLESSIKDSVVKAGEFYEFFYVNNDGQVWYDRNQAIEYFKSNNLGTNLAIPESGQAWTISAVMAILSQV